jgi:hypothetical protein
LLSPKKLRCCLHLASQLLLKSLKIPEPNGLVFDHRLGRWDACGRKGRKHRAATPIGAPDERRDDPHDCQRYDGDEQKPSPALRRLFRLIINVIIDPVSIVGPISHSGPRAFGLSSSICFENDISLPRLPAAGFTSIDLTKNAVQAPN